MLRTQTELACTLAAAREQTDALFNLVRPDSLYERPIPERHRMVFYVGHLEAFDWNLLARDPLSSGCPAAAKLFQLAQQMRIYSRAIKYAPFESVAQQASHFLLRHPDTCQRHHFYGNPHDFLGG
jgi:hypothetical protein